MPPTTAETVALAVVVLASAATSVRVAVRAAVLVVAELTAPV
jgi:hypothetical protein